MNILRKTGESIDLLVNQLQKIKIAKIERNV